MRRYRRAYHFYCLPFLPGLRICSGKLERACGISFILCLQSERRNEVCPVLYLVVLRNKNRLINERRAEMSLEEALRTRNIIANDVPRRVIRGCSVVAHIQLIGLLERCARIRIRSVLPLLKAFFKQNGLYRRRIGTREFALRNGILEIAYTPVKHRKGGMKTGIVRSTHQFKVHLTCGIGDYRLLRIIRHIRRVYGRRSELKELLTNFL